MPKTWQNVTLILGTMLGGMKCGGPDRLALPKMVDACLHAWLQDAIEDQRGTCFTSDFSLRAPEVQV